MSEYYDDPEPFDPSMLHQQGRGGVATAPPTPGVPDPEVEAPQGFDPRRDIDPLAYKFFEHVEGSRHISDENKYKMQMGMIKDMSDIQGMRSKLDAQRRESVISEQRINESQEMMRDTRRRQAAAVNASEMRTTLAGDLQATMAGDLTDEQRRAAINAFEIENIGHLASDPQMARMLDMTRRQIPQPTSAVFTPQQMVELGRIGVPPEVLRSNDPVFIGQVAGYFDIENKAREDARAFNIKEVTESRREARRMRVAIAEKGFNFMNEEEREVLKVGYNSEGIFVGDPNQYLKEDDHRRGKILMAMMRPELLEAHEALTDEQKREIYRELQMEAIKGAYADLEREVADPQGALTDAQSAAAVP